MVKCFIKRILVFSSVACLVLACVPSVSFAIDPVSGAAALAGAMDAYGMAYGVGTVYDVSSSSGVTSSFEGLWDEFSSYQSNAGSQFDYDSFIDDYNQNRSLYGFEHSSGKFAAWYIDSESAEVFDQFWNWLLSGPAEMTRVDNEYFQFSQDQIGPDSTPIVVASFSNSGFPGQPVVSGYRGQFNATAFSNGLSVGNISEFNSPAVVNPASDGTYFFYSGGSIYSFNVNNYSAAFSLCMLYQGNSYIDRGNVGSLRTYTYNNVNYTYSFIAANLNPVSIPVFSTMEGGFLAIIGDSAIPSDDVGVKAYGNGYVNIPDPTKPDYVPSPLEIVTNIPWDSSYDDTDEEDGQPVPFPPLDVPLVVDDILSAISAEDYSIEEDPQNPDPDAPPPAPSEVFVPLLPVGLPSFNFSLSGIWHYVREWVASLGAWFTTMFTIWSALPYAMVVPVYATAVVVIVLGVYKRFFM